MARLQSYFTPALETTAETEPTLAALLNLPETEAFRILAMIDGDPVSNESLCEALECFIEDDLRLPLVVSAEDFKSRLERIWEVIKAFLKRVVDFLTADVEERYQISALKFRAENLRYATRTQSLTRSTAPIQVNQYLNAITTLYRPPRNIGVVNASLLTLTSILKQYFQYVDHEALQGLNTLTTRISSLRVDTLTPEVLHSAVIRPIQAFTPVGFIEKLGVVQRSGDDLYFGPQMMGNVRLRVTTGGGNRDTLRYIAGTTLSLTLGLPSPRPMPNVHPIPRFTLTQSNQTIDNVLNLCTAMGKSVERYAERKRNIEALTRAFDGLVRDITMAENLNPGLHSQVQTLTTLSRTTTQWVTQSYRGMVGCGIRAASAALWLCSANAKP